MVRSVELSYGETSMEVDVSVAPEARDCEYHRRGPMRGLYAYDLCELEAPDQLQVLFSAGQVFKQAYPDRAVCYVPEHRKPRTADIQLVVSHCVVARDCTLHVLHAVTLRALKHPYKGAQCLSSQHMPSYIYMTADWGVEDLSILGYIMPCRLCLSPDVSLDRASLP